MRLYGVRDVHWEVEATFVDSRGCMERFKSIKRASRQHDQVGAIDRETVRTRDSICMAKVLKPSSDARLS